MHDGIHPHGHSHAHGDEGHTHDPMNGLGASSGMDKEKLTKVLSYMKDHNREHARELRGLLDSAGELGSLDIADLVENGATSIDEAADNIEIAIELLANS